MAQLQRATWSLVAGALLLGACSDPLEVENVNNPERGQVFAQGRDLETLAGRLYQNVHEATVGPRTATGAGTELDAIYPQLITLGLENVSALNNFGMGPRGGIPRGLIDNGRGNNFSAGNRRDFRSLQNAARGAITVLERLADTSFTIGTDAADARAESFAYFGLGTSLGNVALIYDSAAVPIRGAVDSVPALVSYKDVMAAGLAALDTAQLIAESAAFTGTIPGEWLAASGGVSKADFIRIIRSYKARFRAQVARTPAERAAVNWTQVIADANAGITSDFVLQLTPSGGWDYSWLVQHFTTGAANWHQMTYYVLGFADTTSAFDTWLATARDNRTPFLIRTPDKRFPAGETRTAQNAASPATDAAGAAAGRYIRNRLPSEDQPGQAWGVSFYDFFRWRQLYNATRTGPWVTFSKVENDMYAAEGYIRTNNIPAAVALINVSRNKNGLAPIPASISRTAGVPAAAAGSNACVPRVPDPARGYTATKCGDVLEAAKWESRMESAYASFAAWYFNGRGWGDLPEGTVIELPVPFQEADARGIPFKNLGGAGQPGGAAPSTTYGYGTGAR
jgi:hypothetical protein